MNQPDFESGRLFYVRPLYGVTIKTYPLNYQTFQPHPDLEALVKCYWTLEVQAESDAPRQRIVPDGCIEMAFNLGDYIKLFRLIQ